MSERAKNTIISWAVASGLAIAIFCFAFFFRGLTFSYASDASFFAGAALVAWPVLVWTTRSGVFDTLGYAMVSDSLKDFAIKELYIDMTDGLTGGAVYDYEGYYSPTGGKIDLGTNGTYDDKTADANAPEISVDGAGKMTVTLDLSNYIADSRFNTVSSTGDETKDPKQIWFKLTYTAMAAGSKVGGVIGYSNDYGAASFFQGYPAA